MPSRFGRMFLVGALVVGPLAAAGCNETLSEKETVTRRKDGTVIRDRETVKEKPDGTIVVEKDMDVDRD